MWNCPLHVCPACYSEDKLARKQEKKQKRKTKKHYEDNNNQGR